MQRCQKDIYGEGFWRCLLLLTCSSIIRCSGKIHSLRIVCPEWRRYAQDWCPFWLSDENDSSSCIACKTPETELLLRCTHYDGYVMAAERDTLQRCYVR